MDELTLKHIDELVKIIDIQKTMIDQLLEIAITKQVSECQAEKGRK